MPVVRVTVVLFVLLSFALGAAPARAETQNCTPVTSLPAFITVQGIYCFTGNLSTAVTSGTAIQIQTNNVVLDLNGFELSGLPAGPGTTAIGIFASNRQNITIKNGTIGRFKTGILLDTGGLSQAHIVEDIHADHNTIVGLDVRGAGSIIRNNRVAATGGTTLSGDANAVGIQVACADSSLVNNDVVDVAAQGSGTSWGIFIFDGLCGTGAMAVGNRISGADKGIEYGAGITGKYFDNTTFDVTTPYTGGTDAGNND